MKPWAMFAFVVGIFGCQKGTEDVSPTSTTYIAIPSSSVDCLHRLVSELRKELRFRYELHELAVLPPGAKGYSRVLEINAGPNVDKQVAMEIVISRCLPQNADVFPIGSVSSDEVTERIRSRRASDVVFLDYVDDEIYVYLFEPPGPDEEIRGGALTDDEVNELGLHR
jgi:hypothetical protein